MMVKSTPLVEPVGAAPTFDVGAAAAAHATTPLPELPKASPADVAPLYPVVKVVDGDTIAVLMNGKSVTIRLIGLDTPEVVDPRKPVQCFGQEASNEAKKLLAGKGVWLEQDPTQDTYDKYGRLLAYVFFPDGTNFEELMISGGYGHEYTYQIPYKYQKEFKAAENNAREEKKGLWADGVCSTFPTVVRQVEQAQASGTSSFSNGQYECTKNVYNCSSFKTHAEAQAAFEACGGDANDIHRLDPDKDGKACESLP